MSKETRKKKAEHYAHKWEVVERSIPGLSYYYNQCAICHQVAFPIPQMQKLWEYSKTRQFLFIHDWVLALLYSGEMPMIGITSFEKQLFLTFMEFAQKHEIPTENPGFRGYKFGPYSERIEDVIISLEEGGLIRTEGRRGTEGEYFMLTEEGKTKAKQSFEKLTSEQQKDFRDARRNWHQLGTSGLEKLVYRKYPDFTKESLVVERVLHKRRVSTREKRKSGQK
jgi:uncharacterized protein YwgA